MGVNQARTALQLLRLGVVLYSMAIDVWVWFATIVGVVDECAAVQHGY